MTENRNKILDVAKRIKLQARFNNRNEQERIRKTIGDKISFLDPETTLALFNQINSSHIWHSSGQYSKFTSIEFEESFGDKLETIAKSFSDFSKTAGYCFPLNWFSSGVIIIELSELMNRLNDYMFAFDDEIKFYTSDLTKVMHLTGDRSGTWDQLNELSISVLGADWVKKVENLNVASA